MTARMLYREYIIPSAALTQTQVFRFSPYDPNQTGVGSQPVGFDQMMALYLGFIVMRARAYVEVGSTSSTLGFHANSWIATNSAQPATDNAIGGQKSFQEARVGNSGAKACRLHVPWFSLPKYFGLTDATYRSDDQFQGAASNDPTTVVFWHNFYQYNSIDNISCVSSFVVEMEVEFFNPVQLASS